MSEVGAIPRDAIGWKQPGKVLLAAVGIGAVLFHIYYGYFGLPPSLWYRPAHLLFFAPLPFVLTKARAPWSRALDYTMAVLVAASVAYILVDFDRIETRYWMVDEVLPLDYVFCGILILGLAEGCRRYFGIVLPLLALGSIAYMMFGWLIPGRYGHDPQPLNVIVDQLYLSDLGIFGPVLGASAEVVILFIMFGLFLASAGIDRTLFDIAKLLVGRSVGGIAKVAVGASALFGTISGSTTANIVATGSLTIPMMKTRGYDRTFAASVEAAASTGGQIMPPVMGATAFLIAALLGIPYLDVVRAALVPGIAYFYAVFLIIHLYASRRGLAGLAAEDIVRPLAVFKRTYVLLPIVILTVLLVMNYSAQLSVLVAMVAVLVIGALGRETRITPRKFAVVSLQILESAAPIAIACATAGIIVGSISLTGVGLKLSSTIAAVGGDSPFVALVLTMIVSIILGMGVPTPAAYITASAIMAPGLVRLGFDTLVAHMFVFYFACLSSITPPVAIGAYVAAGIAGSSPIETAFRSCRMAIAAFVVPYLFAFEADAIFLRGDAVSNLIGVTLMMGGLTALVLSFEGWLKTRLGLTYRAAFLLAAVIQLAVPLDDHVRALGLGLFIALVAWQCLRSSPGPAPAAAEPTALRKLEERGDVS